MGSKVGNLSYWAITCYVMMAWIGVVFFGLAPVVNGLSRASVE